MTVIANDFVPVKPYTTTNVTLGVSFIVPVNEAMQIMLKCKRLGNEQTS